MSTAAKKIHNLVNRFLKAKKSSEYRKRRCLLVEELSPRHMMASLNEIVEDFNYGMLQLRASSGFIGSNAFSEDIPNNLPIIGERDFDESLSASKEIRKLFAGSITNSSSIDAAISSLTSKGFVIQTFNTEPDSSGDFIRLSRNMATAPSKGLRIPVQDMEGIDYLANAVGSYSGTLSGSTQGFSGSLIIGLDANGFYLGEQSRITARKLSFTGSVSGQVDIGVLDEVKFSGLGSMTGTIGVRFKDLDKDGKLRIGDLKNDSAIVGSMTSATIQLRNMKFEASIPAVGNIQWSGNFRTTVSGNKLTTDTKLVAPNYTSIVNQLGLSFVEGLRQIDWIQRVNDQLQTKLPMIDKTLADLLDTQDIVDKALEGVGINLLPLAERSAAMDKLIRGENVDLAYFKKSFDVSIGEIDIIDEITLVQLDIIPGLLGGKLTGSITGSLSLNANIHVGVGAKGFWINDETSVGVKAGVYGNLKGEIYTLLLPIVEAKASAGVDANFILRLTSPVAGSDRIYLEDLDVPTSQRPSALLKQMSVDFKVGLSLKIKATLVKVYSKEIKFDKVLYEYHEGPKSGQQEVMQFRNLAIYDDSLAYEAELLPVLGKSNNMSLQNRDMTGSTIPYSGQRQLLLSSTGAGWAEFELNSAKEIRYALGLNATRGIDQSAVRVLLNNQVLADKIDLYQDGSTVRGESINLGYVDLNRGRNVLRIEVLAGQGSSGRGNLQVGIDGIDLTDPSYDYGTPGQVGPIEIENRGLNYMDVRWPMLQSAAFYGVEVLRDGTWVNIGNTSGGQSRFRLSNLQSDTNYRLRVTAHNANGSGTPTELEMRTRDTLPNAPTGLVVENRYAYAVDLRWQDVSRNESQFRIAISRDGGNSWDNVGTVSNDSTSFRVENLQPSTRYMFKVRAANDVGFSDYTNSVEVTTRTALPNAPGNLRVANTWSRTVDLNWDDQSNNESEFRIAISRDGGNSWDNVGTVGVDSNGFRVENLQPGMRYLFKVRAANEAGFSDYTNTAEVTTRIEPPNAPGNLRVANTWSRTVDLNWDDLSNNESEFRIAISRDGGNSWDNVGTVGVNSNGFRVENLQPGTRYLFKVRAANEAGFSDYTNTAEVTTRIEPPTAPENLRVANIWARTIDLAWDDRSNTESEFRIAISRDGGRTWDNVGTVGANETRFRVNNLNPRTTYLFRVRAANFEGLSDFSNIVTVTTKN